MKKKYKGYFKKPTGTLPDVKFKKAKASDYIIHLHREAMYRTVGKHVSKIFK